MKHATLRKKRGGFQPTVRGLAAWVVSYDGNPVPLSGHWSSSPKLLYAVWSNGTFTS